MRSIVVLAVLVLGCSGKEGKAIDQAAGSGSSSSPTAVKPSLGSGGAGDFESALTDLERYRQKMCACPDVACSDALFKEFTTWRQEFRKGNTTRPKPTWRWSGGSCMPTSPFSRSPQRRTSSP